MMGRKQAVLMRGLFTGAATLRILTVYTGVIEAPAITGDHLSHVSIAVAIRSSKGSVCDHLRSTSQALMASCF